MNSIRLYQEKDISQIQDIWNEIVKEGTSYMYDKVFTYKQVKEMLVIQDVVYCIVNSKDEVMGFYILHPNFAGRGSHIANATYGIGKEYRGLGLGKKLGFHSIEIAKQLGFEGFQFNAVVSTNAGAVKVWEQIGFKKIGEIPEAFKRDNGKIVSIFIYYMKL